MGRFRSCSQASKIEVLLNEKKLSMLDTGADVTIIDTRAWMNFGHPELQPYSSSCVNVSGKKIKTVGSFHATLSYKGNFTKVPIIVLNRPNTALMSAQVIDSN